MKHLTLWRKIGRLVLAFALAFSLIASLALTPAPVRADEEPFNQEFEDWLYQDFLDSLESDYLTMHFTVRDYKSYNIEKPEVTLGTLSYEDYAAVVEDFKAYKEELLAFDYESLSSRQKADYDSYLFSLECQEVLYSHPEFEDVFNPYSGILENMKTNLTEFVFYSQEDIDDYLILAADLGRLIDDMIPFTQKQVDQGIFMTDASLDLALEGIDEFINAGEDNPLIQVFEERIDAFEGIDDAARASYKERNREILENTLYPAYGRAREALEGWRGSNTNELGICKYPGGQEYYNALLKYRSSLDMTPQEMYEFSIDSFDYAIDYFNAVMKEEGGNGISSSTGLTTPDQVLEYLRANMQIFPKGPEVTYTASYLEESLRNPSVIAYYMPSPLDQLHENVIRINPDSIGDSEVELYQTLAHEGFPGHCYEHTLYFDREVSPARKMVNMLGYQEGWAMYVSDIMTRYSPLDKTSAAYAEVVEYTNYLDNAIMDIGINGLGWDLADLIQFAQDSGWTLDAESAKDIMEYLTAIPGNLVSYGVGEAFFMTMRDKALTALHSDFNEVEFHEVLLVNGPRPLASVERDIDEWLTEKGCEIPERYFAYQYETEHLTDPASGSGNITPKEESGSGESSSQGTDSSESSESSSSSSGSESESSGSSSGQNSSESQSSSGDSSSGSGSGSGSGNGGSGGTSGGGSSVNALPIIGVVMAALGVILLVTAIIALASGKKKQKAVPPMGQSPYQPMPQGHYPNMPQETYPSAPQASYQAIPQPTTAVPQPEMPGGEASGEETQKEEFHG